MTAKELNLFFDRIISKELSCDWDNDGIMCMPDPERQVKRVLITLDITKEAAEYAKKGGFDTIISHHPLIFRPLKGITSEKLIGLIKNDICALSFHTRLDMAQNGVNDALSEAIGLKNVEKLPPDGLGRIGELEEEMTVEDFIIRVKKALGCGRVSFVKGKDSCRRVVLVGGSGKDYIDAAFSAGADLLLTGEASYNSMADAKELPLSVVEAGHYFTEQPVCKKIAELLKSADPDIEAEIFECNPVKEL